MSKENENLISEALKTYKIPPEYVFASRENEEAGEAVGVKRWSIKKGKRPNLNCPKWKSRAKSPLKRWYGIKN